MILIIVLVIFLSKNLTALKELILIGLEELILFSINLLPFLNWIIVPIIVPKHVIINGYEKLIITSDTSIYSNGFIWKVDQYDICQRIAHPNKYGINRLNIKDDLPDIIKIEGN